ncbi:MAG: acetyltransferase [Cyclobacteriaceae bacterium]
MHHDLLLIGGGGHCKSVIDVLEKEGRYQIKGIIDVAEKAGLEVLDYPIIGTEDALPELLKTIPQCLITVGQLGKSESRLRIYRLLKKLGAKLPIIISPLAYVSPHARLGEGTVVMHQACVNAGVQIGINCIINSQALLEHDAHIGDHCHISTAATINGDCRLGDQVFVGSGARLRQGVSITSGSLIGMGSIVLQDIAEAGTYAGIPSRRIS